MAALNHRSLVAHFLLGVLFFGASSLSALEPTEADQLPPRVGTEETLESISRRMDALEIENESLKSQLAGYRPSAETNGDSVLGTLVGFRHLPSPLVSHDWRSCPDLGCDGIHPEALCVDCPRITTLNPYFNLRAFGALTGEVVISPSRPLIPSGIVLITPNLGQETPVTEVHAKSSSAGVAFNGPEIDGYKTGGLFLSYLYGELFTDDKYGVYVARAFAEIKNSKMRVAFGLNGDVINPRAPNTINFNRANGAGNLGFFRGQFLLENYFHPHKGAQITTQIAISDPVTTSFTNFDRLPLELLEEHRWPNLEARVLLAMGSQPANAAMPRPFEIGVSGLVGQLRRTSFPNNRIHDVWAVGADFHLAMGQAVGFNGEFFTGQCIGNYNAAIFLVDNTNLVPIRSTGGWGEMYVNWASSWHSHFGCGIDDPLDRTLTAELPTQNRVAFANLIWDVNRSLEVGFEVSHWDTDYAGPGPNIDNDAMVYHTRVSAKF